MSRLLLSAFIVTIAWMSAAAAIAANPKHVERLLKTNQCPLCDLSGADLGEANLYGANLVGANLQGANLNGANLGSANLTDANLAGAKLDRAYLYDAVIEATNFSRADLTNAYLKDAKLTNVQFEGAKLQGANLSRANLVGTVLRGLNLRGVNLAGAALTGVRLPDDVSQYNQVPGQIRTSLCERDMQPTAEEIENAKAAGFELSFADLSQSDLTGAKLRNAVLVGGNLQGANLTEADLSNACVNLANLTKATLDRSNLKETKLQAAILEGASLKDLKNPTNISQAFKTGADAERVPIERKAKVSVGSLIRGQQAFYLETAKFAKTLQEVGLPIKDDKNYRYQVIAGKPENTKVMLVATPKRNGFASFVGLVTVGAVKETQEATTYTALCISLKPTQQLPDFPKIELDAKPSCPVGYEQLKLGN
jgi:uncharacterized protein YjbI with pentapeptide repeats